MTNLPEHGPPDPPNEITCLGCLGTALFVFGFWMVVGGVIGTGYDNFGLWLLSLVALIVGVRLMMRGIRP